MTTTPAEQRNPYKGADPRAWVRVCLLAGDGTTTDLELLADTGSPFHVVVDDATLVRFKRRDGPIVNSNFGPLTGGWLRVVIPDIGFDQEVLGFANDPVVRHAQADCPDFGGLLGLPLLRMMEYGGDADWFWVRPTGGPP